MSRFTTLPDQKTATVIGLHHQYYSTVTAAAAAADDDDNDDDDDDAKRTNIFPRSSISSS